MNEPMKRSKFDGRGSEDYEQLRGKIPFIPIIGALVITFGFFNTPCPKDLDKKIPNGILEDVQRGICHARLNLNIFTP